MPNQKDIDAAICALDKVGQAIQLLEDVMHATHAAADPDGSLVLDTDAEKAAFDSAWEAHCAIRAALDVARMAKSRAARRLGTAAMHLSSIPKAGRADA